MGRSDSDDDGEELFHDAADALSDDEVAAAAACGSDVSNAASWRSGGAAACEEADAADAARASGSGGTSSTLEEQQRLPLHRCARRAVFVARARAKVVVAFLTARSTRHPCSAAFRGDLAALEATLKTVPPSRWTELDDCGNTVRTATAAPNAPHTLATSTSLPRTPCHAAHAPTRTRAPQALHVAVLRHNAEAVSLLLECGFPVKQKSAAGWAAVYEAIAARDEALVRLLHTAAVREDEEAYKCARVLRACAWLPRTCPAAALMTRLRSVFPLRAARARRRQRKPELLAALAALPDFRAALRWEFCSPLFAPLLRRFAPHDTYTLTKRGTSLRVDGTLKGLLQDEEGGAGGASVLPQWDRGAFSLLFSASAADATAGAGGAGSSPAPPTAQLLLVDHDIRETVDVLPPGEARSEEELAEEAGLLLAAGPAKGKLRAKEFRFAPLRTWRGEPRRERAEGWATVVYEAKGRMEAQTRLRSGRFATKVRCRCGFVSGKASWHAALTPRTRDCARAQGTFEQYLASAAAGAADELHTLDLAEEAEEAVEGEEGEGSDTGEVAAASGGDGACVRACMRACSACGVEELCMCACACVWLCVHRWRAADARAAAAPPRRAAAAAARCARNARQARQAAQVALLHQPLLDGTHACTHVFLASAPTSGIGAARSHPYAPAPRSFPGGGPPAERARAVPAAGRVRIGEQALWQSAPLSDKVGRRGRMPRAPASAHHDDGCARCAFMHCFTGKVAH
jgi:hypothetical protein